MSPRILIVTHTLPEASSLAVQRPFKFARYLPQFGWETTLLATSERGCSELDEDLLLDIPKEVRVLRWENRLCKVPISLVAAAKAVRIVREQQVDCIYTTSGMHSVHLVGLVVHRLTGVPWVADLNRPFTQDTSNNRLHQLADHWLEKSVFRYAAKVTTVADCLRAEFERRYPNCLGDVKVIHDGGDPADFPSVWSLPKPGPFALFHAGNLSSTRSPKVLLQAVSTALRYHKILPREIKIVFAGRFDEPGSDENRRLVHDLGLDNIVVELGYLPRKRVLEQMQMADGLLLIGERTDKANQYVPGNLYEYLFAKRPILAMLHPGEAADLIAGLGAGEVLNPSDVRSAANQLVSWVRQKRKGTWPGTDFRCDGRQLGRFTRMSQTAALAEILGELFPEEKNGRMTGSL